MHVCVCVGTCVYMSVYMCACTYIYGHMHVCTYIYVDEKLICVSELLFVRKSTWICTCACYIIFLSESDYVCVRACVWVCNVNSVRVYEREYALEHAIVCMCVCIYKRVCSFCICTLEQWAWMSEYVYLLKRICADEWTWVRRWVNVSVCERVFYEMVSRCVCVIIFIYLCVNVYQYM